MKKQKIKKILIPALLVLIIFVVLVVILVSNKKEKYRLVTVSSVEGSVLLNRTEESILPTPDMHLIPEDEAFVSEASFLSLKADEDKYIAVSENSCIQINATGNTKEGKISVNLVYGEALFTIENPLSEQDAFVVETSNATISVRGTKFTVIYDPVRMETTVIVEEGIVDVFNKASQTSVLLNPGEIAIVQDASIITGDAESIMNSLDVDYLLSAAEGDTVYFGTYENAPLAWTVLRNEGSKVMLISEDYLYEDQFSSVTRDSTWKDSYLRKFLNEDFYESTFNEEEKTLIANNFILIDPTAPYVSGEEFLAEHETYTAENVYILSLEEEEAYLGMTSTGMNGVRPVITIIRNSEENADSDYAMMNPGEYLLSQDEFNNLLTQGKVEFPNPLAEDYSVLGFEYFIRKFEENVYGGHFVDESNISTQKILLLPEQKIEFSYMAAYYFGSDHWYCRFTEGILVFTYDEEGQCYRFDEAASKNTWASEELETHMDPLVEEYVNHQIQINYSYKVMVNRIRDARQFHKGTLYTIFNSYNW